MRRLRIILVLCAVLFVGGLVWVLLSQAHVQEIRLKDGSVIRIEKVSFGKREQFASGGRLQRFLQLMPQSIQKLLGKSATALMGAGSWNMVSTTHTNEKALYVYISRRDGKTGKQMDVDADTAAIVDTHGCVLEETQSGGWNDGSLPPPTGGIGSGMQSTVNWFRFEAFPRREASFRIRLFHRNSSPAAGTGPICEFVINNPAPAPPKSNWTPKPLPVTCILGAVSFALTNVAIQTIRYQWAQAVEPRVAEAQFAVTENGRPSSNWLPLSEELFDSDGNFATEMAGDGRFLCPRVTAWKYRVKFFGDEDSWAASNAVWVLHGVEIPAEGKFTLLNATNLLQGVPFRVGALSGPGIFTYSNSIALESGTIAQLAEGDPSPNTATATKWPAGWRGGRFGDEKPVFRVAARNPFLALDIGELSPDQRLTVRAVDDNGWIFHTHKIWPGNPGGGLRANKTGPEDYFDNGQPTEPPFLVLPLSSDSKKVDIYICVHMCYTAEFIFKPPPEPKTAAGKKLGATTPSR